MINVQEPPDRREERGAPHPVMGSVMGGVSVVAFAGGLAVLVGIAVSVTTGRADAPLVGIMGWLPLLLVLGGAYGAQLALAELRRSVRWLNRRKAA